MKTLSAVLSLGAVLALAATPMPAMADAGGITIDEPTNLALLALGFVGLVVGRRAARRKD